MATQQDTSRAVKLSAYFREIIHGKKSLNTIADSKRFIEALCAQADVSKCVEGLIASTDGLSSIAKCVRLAPDPSFLAGAGAELILRFSDPSLNQLFQGQFLQRILEAIVVPPSFWNAFVDAHEKCLLTEKADKAFAWLLLEILRSQSSRLPDVRKTAEQVTEKRTLIDSSSLDVRNLGQKINHVLQTTSSDENDGPGGRHDNDFSDFRKVRILPTSDEFASQETPFYRRADVVAAVPLEKRGAVHLDNQFRLLREDLLGELRNDFQVATGQKKGSRKNFTSPPLEFHGVDCGIEKRRKPCCIKLKCKDDLPQLKPFPTKAARTKFLKENKNTIKHQSFGCLINGGIVIAFGTVERDEDSLAESPPILVLRIDDKSGFNNALLASKSAGGLRFVQVETPVFAYEPILKCLQKMTDLPLQEQLLDFEPGSSETESSIQPSSIVKEIQSMDDTDLQSVLGTPKPVELDDAQRESFLTGLKKKLSLIQGPPGTGKSFIGALLAKTLHDHTEETILVITFTNHALDQILEDLLDIGIAADSIVRLGSKFTTRTRPLNISEQNSTFRMSQQTFSIIQKLKSESESYHELLKKKIASYRNFRVSKKAILEHLEFSDESEFFNAFTVPEQEKGTEIATKKGKRVNEFYLFDQWTLGKDGGVFKEVANRQFPSIWSMDRNQRTIYRNKWQHDLMKEEVSSISSLIHHYNQCQEQLTQLFNEKRAHVIRSKRIIGCTTTAAAKYTEEILNASPGVILVEEAGEILESHILTALTRKTQQLILIGDHKQLRPKVNDYALTVEKGEGYNLNQSMFERLVLSGVPHTTLHQQHRMRPEISALVRQLTYPELRDAPKTQNRPALRGFQDNVMFISHDHAELNAEKLADRRDEGAKSSKENAWEADLVLKCVRYLGQQGYGTDRIVILTPYLGQLFLIRKKLMIENDPVLNDLDSWDLIRAGLLSPAAAGVAKRPIKLSTIDNYQGEESDIVIISMTRSNSAGEIGFMSSPQRVNVLLSRARNALIMIGNASTFIKSRKGKDVWVPLMKQLKAAGHIYEGFPVKCERHPDKKALLRTAADFNKICPDGGCTEPCGTRLNCGVHKCPQSCHQLSDHSRIPCTAIVTSACPKNHKLSRLCHESKSSSCPKCDTETRAEEKRKQRDHLLDLERERKQKVYADALAEIQYEVEHQKRLLREKLDDQELERNLQMKKADLANMKKQIKGFKGTNVVISTMSLDADEETATEISSQPPNRNERNTSNPTVTISDPTVATSNPTVTTSNSTVTPVQPSVTPGNQASAQSNTAHNADWDKSKAKDDWDYQKRFEGAQNGALDELINMIGLESVKEQFLSIKAKIDATVRQGISLKGERFGAAFLGNPGTGKTTVARLYAEFLVTVGALPGGSFVETSGSALANEGVNECKKRIEALLNGGGGVVFLDEAYGLTNGNSPGGKAVLDYLLAEIENLTGKIVFVFAGYNKQMEAFFSHNPGIPSRIPYQLQFEDYEDQELLMILQQLIVSKYNGAMRVEDGMDGLYLRIVSRRIGRGRGRDGFGNARDVQNKFAWIAECQAQRLKKERRKGLMPDDYLLTKEDLIGPEPSVALKNNAAWSKLKNMIGLKAVKDSVQVLLDTIQHNYQREIEEKPIIQYSLNRCFVGSPGTGKTTVAKYYGKILADIGLLSTSEVVVKNPSDFISNVIGGSERNTKAILESTTGKVLVIDEAYMLGGRSGDKGSNADSFKTAVIDTLVAEVQSTPGEDRCVLLLGYKDQMEDMFRNINPGLARRFPLDSAFNFDDFTDPQLRQILELKLRTEGFEATDQAKNVAMEMLGRARNRPNFGNAGEVDILLDKAKALHQMNRTSGKTKYPGKFEAHDFDPDFDRATRASTNVPLLFEGVIGCEDVVKQLQSYQNTAANMKVLDMDPREQIPFNFLFKGPPGTGKTTTARRMGKVYYDMGFLADAQVVECSATDMIGQYIGHTGPKVQNLMEKALGKILFIDEAYRLAAAGNSFASEAMDELVDCLTKPKYAQKMVVILAGYDKDIDRLMSTNPGLTSRFPETVIFRGLTPQECLKLLADLLTRKFKKSNRLMDLSVLASPSAQFHQRVLQLFQLLSNSKSWGNARDVKSLEKEMFNRLISTPLTPTSQLVLTEGMVIDALEAMLAERSGRNQAVGSLWNKKRPNAAAMSNSSTQNPFNTNTSTNANSNAKPPRSTSPAKSPKPDKASTQPGTGTADPRDAGVTDDIWNQLQHDKLAATAQEAEHQRLRKDEQTERDALQVTENTIAGLTKAEQAAIDKEAEHKLKEKWIRQELERQKQEADSKLEEEERRKHAAEIARLEEERTKQEQERRKREAERVEFEKQRIQKELERRKREAQLAELERERKEKERKKQMDMVAQQKLRTLGVCVQGYQWVKQAHGYRCAGGAHFVSDAQLGL
ncbi:P-loop containing nucleoside triphosphate hydrolase protein [Delitschia confertaspora ATCC 74209]|uniref:P-loop containing nucleoside triphosphate hydrolase protein n=1 Tax=Delitschia confertaspora ATCC 74209 TaxID=1513339 RepID=A0A9P4JUB3_9PLEO|nr:P-loop containing nucleoside triphosphate hydrolase protein [Delitschia confertaspora ATCC 74209]